MEGRRTVLVRETETDPIEGAGFGWTAGLDQRFSTRMAYESNGLTFCLGVRVRRFGDGLGPRASSTQRLGAWFLRLRTRIARTIWKAAAGSVV